MNVLSLFDGMSCGQIALNRIGIKVDNYIASEIKKHAIEITQFNFPNTLQVGDVTKLSYHDGKLHRNEEVVFEGKIDLLIGGSPCQDFSFLKSQYTKEKYGLDGEKSKLFLEYDRIRRECNPKYFLLENVLMKEESKNQLSDYLGVQPIFINSKLVSAQIRKRLYWTNIPNVEQPQDKGIVLKNILETEDEILKEFKVKRTKSREKMWGTYDENDNCLIKGKCKNITKEEKSSCLTTKMDRWNNAGLIKYEDFCRFLTPLECERLQTVPEGYTKILKNSLRYDLLGDGWTVDVICHIFKNIE